MTTYNHSYHLVNYSPWPLTSSLGVLTMLTGMVSSFCKMGISMSITGMIIILMTMYTWWRDIVRESTFQGLHTNKVMMGLKWGMILFITSEVFFFTSFFWSYFHSALSPTIQLGLYWPPTHINPFNPFKIPLLNTILLITSGITITWAHHSLMNKSFKQTMNGLSMTILLGVNFSLIQAYEYYMATFTIKSSVYGATFFMATGFHGLHVIIGIMFLSINLMRIYYKFNHLTPNHHLGFEMAAWYWHFVDIVWLLLYMTMYWWGS